MPKLVKKFLSNMVKESRFGMMEPNTMETGEMGWPKVKVLFIMLMAMFIRVSSSKTGLMDSEYMFIQLAKDTKDFGKTIIRMDLEKKNLKMALDMMACSKMERNGVKEPISGLTVQLMRATG